MPHGPAEVCCGQPAEQGQDISCAILAGALKEVSGAEPQVAYAIVDRIAESVPHTYFQ